MAKKYELIAFVGGFIPTEIVIARSRFRWVIDQWIKYHVNRKYKYTPLQLKHPEIDENGKNIREWVNAWETPEKKEDLEILGDTENRCDVLAVKEDMMKFGEVVDLSEKTDEQVLKEIERQSPKKVEALDDATQRLENIRQDMERKKKAARGGDKKLIIIK